MPSFQRCPQCGGNMHPKLMDNMDKWLVCEHCGHKVDVPDASEVSRVEEYKDASGGTRKVWVTHRREDLGAKAGSPVVVSTLPEELLGTADKGASAGFSADASWDPSKGKILDYQELKAMIDRGELFFPSEDDKRNFEAWIGQNPELLTKDLREVLQAQGLKPGEVRVTTKGFATTRLSPGALPGTAMGSKPAVVLGASVSADNSGDVVHSITTLVKWLVLLGCVVALIVVLLKW